PSLTPTHMPSLTPTPSLVIVSSAYGEGISMRQYPNGPVITYLPAGTFLTVMYGYEIVDGWVWIEVIDPHGLVGWVPQFLTDLVTLTPSPTSKTPTETLTPDSTQTATPSP
ncbi:MAG: SH3 domain-containing protein, partial [Anaerolineae bacterium]|nr:SH3 domain-containing protein [Anaerolineae bacterium]